MLLQHEETKAGSLGVSPPLKYSICSRYSTTAVFCCEFENVGWTTDRFRF